MSIHQERKLLCAESYQLSSTICIPEVRIAHSNRSTTHFRAGSVTHTNLRPPLLAAPSFLKNKIIPVPNLRNHKLVHISILRGDKRRRKFPHLKDTPRTISTTSLVSYLRQDISIFRKRTSHERLRQIVSSLLLDVDAFYHHLSFFTRSRIN